MNNLPHRQLEPEVMNLPEEVRVYAGADFREVNDRFVATLLEFVNTRGPVTALDLGAGPGDIAHRLWQQKPEWTLLATDASEPMLRHAQRATTGTSIYLLTADATRLPLPAQSINVIFSNSLLHHLPDVRPLFAEIRRIGEASAFVLLRDLRRPESEAEARRIVDENAGSEPDLLQEEFYRSLLAAYRPKEMETELRRAGLERRLRVEVITDRHMDIVGRL